MTDRACAALPDAIGVFDSGLGGLSVLRELQAALPNERFVYWADSGYAPYGERGDAYVQDRSHLVVNALRATHRLKALVVACNTATAAAIDSLRAAHPDLPIVGIEPALRPAAALSQTGHIGVLATRGTLNSARFDQLAQRVAGACQLHLQPCDGLAEAIEQLPGAEVTQGPRIQTLIADVIERLGPLGSAGGQIDTLVLGCTHYPLVWPLWAARVGAHAHLIDPAAAVARQLQRVLNGAHALAPSAGHSPHTDGLTLLSTGDRDLLQAAARQWVSDGPRADPPPPRN